MAKLVQEAQEEVAKLRGQQSTYLQDFPSDLDVVRARELSEWQFNLNKKWKVYEELAAVPRSGLASHQFGAFASFLERILAALQLLV
jgi:hypothetical protein